MSLASAHLLRRLRGPGFAAVGRVVRAIRSAVRHRHGSLMLDRTGCQPLMAPPATWSTWSGPSPMALAFDPMQALLARLRPGPRLHGQPRRSGWLRANGLAQPAGARPALTRRPIQQPDDEEIWHRAEKPRLTAFERVLSRDHSCLVLHLAWAILCGQLAAAAADGRAPAVDPEPGRLTPRGTGAEVKQRCSFAFSL
jgi:hypothetical protein